MKKFISIFFKIVIPIVFIIALIGFIIPSSPCMGAHSQIKLACTQMDSVKQALKMFKLDNGTYPTTKEGIEALVQNPNREKYPNYLYEPYLEKYPKDSWGSKIIYRQKGDDFILISYGTDKKEGGEDEEKDIIYPDCSN